ncbi:hypothetical protein JHK85_040985 [Glycine max]|nr:hypothetical protein JHK86_040400 [Glycine max]KAG4966010.1 hypothetical protein JHK85_040985 [Glycine max]
MEAPWVLVKLLVSFEQNGGRWGDEYAQTTRGTHKGATIARKHKLYTVSNIHFTNNLGRYLGFKIVHERITSSLFVSLMDNVRKHLAAWKGHVDLRVKDVYNSAGILGILCLSFPRMLRTTFLP